MIRSPIASMAAIAAAALVTAPSAARAADSVVATVPKATPVDAHHGRAVWSSWDPSVRAYRLTEFSGGQVRTVPIRPRPVPFDVDLGPDARGGMLAVYSRCERPPSSSWSLDGRHGCDIYGYSFASGREFEVPRTNSGADEYWPTVWRSRLAFTRTYTPRDGRDRRLLYWRPFNSPRPSQRLKRGPTRHGDAVPENLDLRSRRVAFVWAYEYGQELRLDTTTGHERRLVRIPGSGASASRLEAQGPTIARGGEVYWALAVGFDAPVYSEIRRRDITSGDADRARRRLRAAPNRDQATTGFAQGRRASWYVHAAGGNGFQIRVATDLDYEDAPPPR